MEDLSNSSFIPKRSPAKRKRKATSRRVYLFTIVSYVLMFATLLGAGGVYLYAKYVDKQLTTEISNLSMAVSDFNKEDMLRVQEFDARLTQAADRLKNHVSIVTLFELIEMATVDTIQISDLDLERVLDNSYKLSAAVVTDSFDSTIFQRKIYTLDEAIDSVIVSDVEMKDQDGLGDGLIGKTNVVFNATLDVPLSVIPYVTEVENQGTVIESKPLQVAPVEASTSSESVSNQTEL